MKLFGERQSIIADTSKITPDPVLPDFFKEVNAKLIDNKFAWAAANKNRIVAEWKKRYEVKQSQKRSRLPIEKSGAEKLSCTRRYQHLRPIKYYNSYDQE